MINNLSNRLFRPTISSAFIERITKADPINEGVYNLTQALLDEFEKIDRLVEGSWPNGQLNINALTNARRKYIGIGPTKNNPAWTDPHKSFINASKEDQKALLKMKVYQYCHEFFQFSEHRLTFKDNEAYPLDDIANTLKGIVCYEGAQGYFGFQSHAKLLQERLNLIKNTYEEGQQEYKFKPSSIFGIFGPKYKIVNNQYSFLKELQKVDLT